MARSRVSFPFNFLLSSSRSAQSTPRPPHVYPIPAQRRPSQPIWSSQPGSHFSTDVVSRRAAAATTTTGRYGTANEPPPHLSNKPASNSNVPEKAPTTAPSKETATAQETQQAAKPAPRPVASHASQTSEQRENAKDANESAQQAVPSQSTTESSAASSQSSAQQADANKAEYPDDGALKTILGMDSLMEGRAEKPPHLEPPPYIHHFDTYTLVRSLQEGGFSEEEAVILMKAVRASLADNMNLARDGLVSKGDAEMSAYLFRSACSELRTEMRNNRASMNERMQSERNALQHEVDVLSQRISAEASSLKDELKGMFDDRKMGVRMERRDLENRNQEVGYTITTRLSSEMKSETEGLRWVLVRRTAMSLALVIVTALLTLRIMQTAEKRKEAAEAANASKETIFQSSASPAGFSESSRTA